MNIKILFNTLQIIAALSCMFSNPASLCANKIITKLSDHLYIYHGHINVGIVCDGRRALLIDCGDASVCEPLSDIGINTVDTIIFTHYHRDQSCGVFDLAASGVRIGAPLKEQNCFENVAAYWNDPQNRWRLYRNFRHLMPIEPVHIDETYSDGDSFTMGIC